MYYMAVGGDLRYLVDRKHHKVVFGGGKGSAPPFYSGKNLLERQAIYKIVFYKRKDLNLHKRNPSGQFTKEKD